MKSGQRSNIDSQFEALVSIVEDDQNDLHTRGDAINILKELATKSETSNLYSDVESLALYQIVNELEGRFPTQNFRN